MLDNSLRFDVLRAANATRCPLFKNAKGEFQHSGRDWLPVDWAVAVLGEMGEAANILKKIRRGDATVAAFRPELVNEFSDIVIYLDMLANSLDLNFAWMMPLITRSESFMEFREYNEQGPERWATTTLNRRMVEAFMHLGVVLDGLDRIEAGKTDLFTKRLPFAVSLTLVLRCIDYLCIDCCIDLGNAVVQTFNNKSEQLELDVYIGQNRVLRHL